MTPTADGAMPVADVPFGEYAAVYDLIYGDKDYAGEAAFVANQIGRASCRERV